MESNTVVVPSQNFVLELTTIKERIVIFGKNKYSGLSN